MRLFDLLAAGALALALGSGPASAADKIGIVAAENIYGDLATEIGGDAVAVTSILSNPDDDPHLFETSPSTGRAVSGADIVISNGADYDPWMAKILAASPSPGRTSIVAADLVGARPGDNPHLWYKPQTLPAVAKALAEALEKRDPANAATSGANLDKFNTAFTRVIDRIAALKVKVAGTKVTATEPVFGYMAEALGLDMLNGAFQNDVMNDAEPSPSEVVQYERSLKDGSVRLLFFNSQVTNATTDRMLSLAKANNVPVVGVTETEPANTTLVPWILGELDAVAAALGVAN